jgi:hypothetical protein
MSHDDVRGMLDSNELSPRFDDDDDGTASDWLGKWDDGDHDLDAMRSDIDNSNLDVGDDDAADRYLHKNIIRESIANGQRAQAREQCKRYGLDFDDFTN